MTIDSRAVIRLSVLALIFSFLLGIGTTRAAGPIPRIAIEGLKERPDLPVRSIPLRRQFPDHPLPSPDHPIGVPSGSGEPPQGGGCDKDIDLDTTLSGVTAVAAQDNVICTNADIDTYQRDGNVYVVQAGGEEAAWTHTDVTDDPTNPVIVGQFVWSGGAGRNTYTPDVKYFSQGSNDYIALSLERLAVNAYCGVVIVNITNPASPVIESQAIGADWCDVHNTFVETENGDGRYIYLTADGPNDMRVLDVGGNGGSVSSPVEIGRYIAPAANNNNYVHDITVLDHGQNGRRVYLSYWDSGLVILDADDVTPGTNPTPIVGPNVIDPAGFMTHHAWASQDGNLVFIQDEFLGNAGDEPVQMWDVSNPAAPEWRDGLVLGQGQGDVPPNPAHNLEIRTDIDADLLYVGWYKLGLQAWHFDSNGFVQSGQHPRTAFQYHQAQTESGDDVYSGAWGVRLEQINGTTYIFQSDRNYGLIVDCVDPCNTSNTSTPPPSTMHVGDLDGASEPGQPPHKHWKATVTILVHSYVHDPVVGATVSGTWSGAATGSDSCSTDGSGQCSITKSKIKLDGGPITFEVADISHTTNTYMESDNEVTVTSIIISQP